MNGRGRGVTLRYGWITCGFRMRMAVPGGVAGNPGNDSCGIGGTGAPANVIASACISVVTARLAVGSMMDPWSPTIKFTYERKPLGFVTGPGSDGALIRES